MLASRRSTAAIVGPGPRGVKQMGRHRLRAPRVRSYWRRAGFRSLPGVACKATRGTPHPVLPLRCLAKSTLGGWDGGTINAGKRPSNESDRYPERAVGKLLMHTMFKIEKVPRTQPVSVQPGIHRNLVWAMLDPRYACASTSATSTRVRSRCNPITRKSSGSRRPPQASTQRMPRPSSPCASRR